jgi:hypothetical protein
VAKKRKKKQVVFDKNNRTKMQLAIAASFSCDMYGSFCAASAPCNW